MADPESSANLDPGNPIDARLIAEKSRIESLPDWPQKKAEIELEYGASPISPQDLAKPRTHEEYVASLDRALANHAALEAEQAKQKERETPLADSAPRDVQRDTQEFGRILGVAPGSPEFAAKAANFASWYDDSSTDPNFDQDVAKYEKRYGTEAVLRVADILAEAHARKRH